MPTKTKRQPKKVDLTIDQILIWIVDHKDDTASMDRINFLSYAGTSKYKRQGEHNRRSIVDTELDQFGQPRV